VSSLPSRGESREADGSFAQVVSDPLVVPQDPTSRLNTWQVKLFSGKVTLAAFVVMAVAVRVNVIMHFNVNWDEFFYLSQVYDYFRGDLGLKLQTFQVHLFGWLPGISGNEVDQVIAARGVMLGFNLLTAALLYRISRRLTGSPAALFAIAAYLSVSLVIRNGASFRSDPIATCLIMAAFDLSLTRARTVWQAGLAGLSFALAGLITIKTAIFLPSWFVLLGVPLLDRRTAGMAARRAAAAALTAVVSFALLYRLHSMMLGHATAQSSTDLVATSLAKTVTKAGFFPQSQVLVATLKWDMIFWAFLLIGGGILVRRIWHSRGGERLRWIETAALALPVGSIVLYRNSFPYFYPFILAPASVLTALTWQRLSEGTPRQGVRVLRLAASILALAWFGVSLVLHGIYLPRVMPLQHQRAVVAVVHRMFPAPVPYLDRSSLIASFPRAGFFMTTWGIDAYREGGQPVLERAIRERQPPLLIADHPALDLEHAVYPDLPPSRPILLAADRDALRQTYVHYWGPIYVAGRHLDLSRGEAPTSLELSIAGRYTLEANGPVRIDGRLLRPGEVADLARGSHEISVASSARPATLRWGEGLYRPAQPPPTLPVFLGF
jgi:hypothetical protein